MASASTRKRFEQLALPHLNHLHRVAFHLTRNEADAEELVQETYLRAFRSFHLFVRGLNCRAWLLRIERNVFLNLQKKKSRMQEVPIWDDVRQTQELSDEGARNLGITDPEAVLSPASIDCDVQAALQNLPEKYRAVITLVDVTDLTYEGAAKVTGCAVGTVRSRLSRARRMLQALLLQQYAKQRD